jgi:8-oxo-dGTP diphosphatase
MAESDAREAKLYVRLRCSALVRRGEEILIVRHNRGDRSYWVLPGGGPVDGEIASAAVEREVQEETGLRVRASDVVFTWEAIDPDQRVRITELVFNAELMDTADEPVSPDPTEEPRFVPIDTLGDLLLYPPVAGYLRGSWRSAVPRGAPYLGNMWRTMPAEDRELVEDASAD